MKILHCFETLPGGPATYINELLPLQVQRYGVENIHVLCPEKHLPYVKDFGQHMHGFAYERRTAGAILKSIPVWRTMFREISPDIIHLHSTVAGLIGRLVPRTRAKIVYCSHGWAFDAKRGALKNKAIAWIERVLSARSDAIINISAHDHDRALAIGIPAEKCNLILNGIAFREDFSPAHVRKPIRILFAGRLDYQKGIDLLDKAAAQLEVGYAKITVVGRAVQNGDHRMHSTDTINYVGWKSLEEVNRMMAESDVLIVPSRWEGFGLVALEAMRAGRAVAASAVGGLTELVSDGDNGVLFDTNDETALVAALKRLGSLDLREMGLRGRSRFESKYLSETMERTISDLYRKVY